MSHDAGWTTLASLKPGTLFEFEDGGRGLAPVYFHCPPYKVVDRLIYSPRGGITYFYDGRRNKHTSGWWQRFPRLNMRYGGSSG